LIPGKASGIPVLSLRQIGHKIRQKRDTFLYRLLIQQNDIRNAMVEHLLNAGIEVEPSIMK
jgi:hypothetical protein